MKRRDARKSQHHFLRDLEKKIMYCNKYQKKGNRQIVFDKAPGILLTFVRNIHGSIRSQPIDKSPLMAHKVFSRQSQSPPGKRDWRRVEMERQSVTEPK